MPKSKESAYIFLSLGISTVNLLIAETPALVSILSRNDLFPETEVCAHPHVLASE